MRTNMDLSVFKEHGALRIIVHMHLAHISLISLASNSSRAASALISLLFN